MIELDNKNLQLKQIIVKDFFPPSKLGRKNGRILLQTEGILYIIKGDD
jgi:hypothetical protein